MTDEAELQKQIDEINENLKYHVEDLREKILKLAKDFDDAEIDQLNTDVETLREELEDYQNIADQVSNDVEELHEQVDDIYDKLDTLAFAHNRLKKRHAKLYTMSEELRDLRGKANNASINTAVCRDCGENIVISLLNACECPECGSSFIGIKKRRIRSSLLITEVEEDERESITMLASIDDDVPPA